MAVCKFHVHKGPGNKAECVMVGLALKIRGFPCLSPTHRQSHGAADDKKIQVQRNAAKGTGMFHTSISPSLYK